MAYVANQQDDEEQKNPAQGAVPPSGGAGSAGVQLAPSSGVGSVGGTGTAAQPGQPAAGGLFATLDKYISANQGQAQPIADKVTAGIGQEYSSLQGGNQSTLNDIGNQVAAGSAPTANANDIIAKEAANPVSFSGDQGNVKQFQGLLNASYAGPASAESTTGFANQQNAINQAIAAGQNQTTTEAGREQLLSQNEAAPSTSVTGLNSAILATSPTALGQVENAYRPFSNLLTNLSTGAQGVNQTISKAQSDAAAANKAANEAISSQITGLNTAVGGELTSAQKNATDQANTLKADLAAGNPTPADLAALGLTSAQWNSLSAADKAAATSKVLYSANGQFGANTGTTNIDLTNFLTAQDPNLAYTAANVATPEQYAQAQAFQTLLNGLNLGTPTTAINPTTAAQAGTAPKNLSAFDYQTALNTAQSAQAEETAAAQAYADSMAAGADEAHAEQNAELAAKKAGMYGAGAIATGTVAPGMAGYASGVSDSLKGDIQNPSLAHTADILNSITGPKAVVNTAKGIEQGVAGAVNTISQIFCFHPDTLVEMANGTLKRICDVAVGDITRGGKVLATTRGIGQGFYWYEGVLVTAKHAVKEDGVWTRVENSKKGRQFKYLTEIVCNLVTEKHRIWASGIEFADEYETDLYEALDLDESLEEMNKNGQSLG